MKQPGITTIPSRAEKPDVHMKHVRRRIRFESELDLDFGEYIAAKAYGQKLLSCIQCGTCSATCPVSHYMDYSPRRIIAMTREGFKDQTLNSLTIWLCASCYMCTVQCPRQIHITDVMYTLKREAIARGIYPRDNPIPVLARQFFRQVQHNGRNTESRVLIGLYLHSNPFAMLKEAWLGFRLFVAGRLSLKKESIRQKDQLQTIMNSIDAAEGTNHT
jgi:quinone-modifying oxidoreductase, subunit QmoC